jgi:hypothetical protein
MFFRNITKNSSRDGRCGKPRPATSTPDVRGIKKLTSTTSATELRENDFVAATDGRGMQEPTSSAQQDGGQDELGYK